MTSFEAPGATIVYDVRGPLPAADGRPPLVLIGQPMDARGFATLAPLLADRTVVTPDPRGLGRSVRTDGRTDNDPVDQAEDLHRLVGVLGVGPVDLFASSGGAITALALVAAHPDDVRVLVAHEPPLVRLLPDADAAAAAEAAVQKAYAEKGMGAGMSAFIAMVSHRGELPADFAGRLADAPGFGLSIEDDGSRDDPLMSGASNAVTAYRPDVAALTAAPTRIVVAAGVESAGTLPARAAAVLAAELGLPLTEFPSHHSGFLGGEFGQAGAPEAFAERLREVLG